MGIGFTCLSSVLNRTKVDLIIICVDERHEVPCPQPCLACSLECEPEALRVEDDDVCAYKRWREAEEG